MPIYSTSDTQWPLLQSKTEQKFKSGLFAVSAEFVAPADTTSDVETIESSIGDVDVYPSPVENYDGGLFKKISATGYSVWDSTISDEVIFQEPVELVAGIYFLEFARDENGQPVFPRRSQLRYEEKKITVIGETGVVKKITTAETQDNQKVPSLSRFLEIAQEKKQWQTSEFFNLGRNYDKQSFVESPTKTEILSNLSSQVFTPEIVEYSATYSLRLEIYFGIFTEIESENEPETP
jgi:hypothetical protein